MMVSKINKKGFTLVELLGTIVIIGILSGLAISGVTRMINNAKKETSESQKKTIKMAAESYFQSNVKKLPKVIGSSSIVSAKELNDAKYITTELKNEDGDSCMENSYVKIYKKSASEYVYTPYIYCGDEKPEAVAEKEKPLILLNFSDKNDLKNASFEIKIYGDSKKEASDANISGYSYSISGKFNGENDIKEIYNSGSLSANNKKYLHIKKKFSDYIDLSGVSTFYVEVSAINENGESASINLSDSINGVTYVDNVAPICDYANIKNEPAVGSWIKKGDKVSDRVITIGCSDGEGSGCKREEFSKSWPYDEDNDGKLSDIEKGIENSYIEIYDNYNVKLAGNTETGNKTLCKVRVNVDLVSPSASLTAYSGSTKVLGPIKVNDSNETSTIKYDDYSKLVNNWMNKSNYGNGVTYVVKVDDNLHLDHWTWETNASGLTDAKYDVSLSNPDAAFGSFSQPTNSDRGNMSDSISFGFNVEGKRYGVLTIYDAAGNHVSYNISAYLDRTAPPVPTFDAKKIENEDEYTFFTWYNKKSGIRVYATGSGTDSMSGHKNYRYKVNNGSWIEKNSVDIKDDGKTSVSFSACDQAENCSDSTSSEEVWIDTVKPTCDLDVRADGVKYNGDWTNAKVITATATCGDSGSGCTVSTKSKSYNTDMNVSNASVSEAGVGHDYYFYDHAGNNVKCPNFEIKRDTIPPTCKVSGGNAKATSGTRTITAKCSDSGSGCKKQSLSLVYDKEIDTKTAGVLGDNEGGSFEDKAENVGYCKANQKVKIVRKPPKCPDVSSSTPAGTWTNNSITFTFKFQPETTTVPKATSYEWYTDNSSGWKNWGKNNVSVTSKSISGEGNRSVQMVVSNQYGLTTTCTYSNYLIDKTDPKYTHVKLHCGDTGNNGFHAYMQLNFKDDLSGLGKRVTSSWDSRNDTHHKDVNYGGARSAGDTLGCSDSWIGYSHKICDRAGNCASKSNDRQSFSKCGY